MKPSFCEIINTLHSVYIDDANFAFKNAEFYEIIDLLDNKDILKYAECLVKIKNLCIGKFEDGEWFKLCQIINYMKTYNRFTQMPWTQKQKRFCVIMIIKMWDDIQLEYNY